VSEKKKNGLPSLEGLDCLELDRSFGGVDTAIYAPELREYHLVDDHVWLPSVSASRRPTIDCFHGPPPLGMVAPHFDGVQRCCHDQLIPFNMPLEDP
jgi:hypothetical protein